MFIYLLDCIYCTNVCIYMSKLINIIRNSLRISLATKLLIKQFSKDMVSEMKFANNFILKEHSNFIVK